MGIGVSHYTQYISSFFCWSSVFCLTEPVGSACQLTLGDGSPARLRPRASCRARFLVNPLDGPGEAVYRAVHSVSGLGIVGMICHSGTSSPVCCSEVIVESPMYYSHLCELSVGSCREGSISSVGRADHREHDPVLLPALGHVNLEIHPSSLAGRVFLDNAKAVDICVGVFFLELSDFIAE